MAREIDITVFVVFLMIILAGIVIIPAVSRSKRKRKLQTNDNYYQSHPQHVPYSHTNSGMTNTKGRLLNDGGEGYIHEVNEDPNLLMKIYKETDSLGEPIVTPELTNKLRLMIANPPTVLIEKRIIAWPLEAVWERQNPRPRVSKMYSFEMERSYSKSADGLNLATIRDSSAATCC